MRELGFYIHLNQFTKCPRSGNVGQQHQVVTPTHVSHEAWNSIEIVEVTVIYTIVEHILKLGIQNDMGMSLKLRSDYN